MDRPERAQDLQHARAEQQLHRRGLRHRGRPRRPGLREGRHLRLRQPHVYRGPHRDPDLPPGTFTVSAGSGCPNAPQIQDPAASTTGTNTPDETVPPTNATLLQVAERLGCVYEDPPSSVSPRPKGAPSWRSPAPTPRVSAPRAARTTPSTPRPTRTAACPAMPAAPSPPRPTASSTCRTARPRTKPAPSTPLPGLGNQDRSDQPKGMPSSRAPSAPPLPWPPRTTSSSTATSVTPAPPAPARPCPARSPPSRGCPRPSSA